MLAFATVFRWFKFAFKNAKNVGSKVAKNFVRNRADSSNSNPDPNAKDPAVYIAQAGGAAAIFFFVLIYKFIAYCLGKEKDWVEVESNASLGMITGVAFATSLGKILDKVLPGLGSIWTAIIGFGCGVIGGLIFTLVPALATCKKNTTENNTENTTETDSTLLKLGVKLGTTIISGLAALVCLLIPGTSSLMTAICSTVGFFVGAIVGAKAFPKLAKYLEKKGFKKFTKRVDIAYSVGGAIGGAIGAFIGTCVFPVIGTTIGGLIGAAVGALIVVPIFAIFKSIYKQFKDPNLDFSAKVGAVIGGAIGAIIGNIFLPVLGMYGGMMAGAAIGTVLGICVVKIATYSKLIFNSLRDPTPPATVTNDNQIKIKKSEDDTLFAEKLNLAVSAGILFAGFIGGIIAGPLGAAIGSVCGIAVGLVMVGISRLYERYKKNDQPVLTLPAPEKLDDGARERKENQQSLEINPTHKVINDTLKVQSAPTVTISSVTTKNNTNKMAEPTIRKFSIVPINRRRVDHLFARRFSCDAVILHTKLDTKLDKR